LPEEREMMRQKSHIGRLVLVFSGLGLFGSFARSPSFDTYRTFDIVSLVLVGACFGLAIPLFTSNSK
jgi:hypothetical protein